MTTSICDLFDGDIDKFLAEEVSIFSDIQQLLDRQFDRLSPIEQTVMYWLAIEREWTSSADLHPQIVPAIAKSHLFATLESLSRKSPIEHNGGKFTQQAVVMEYMTERSIDRVANELTNWDLHAERLQHLPVWLSFSLMAAQAPAYIQTIQRRHTVAPIASQLQLQFGNKSVVAGHLRSIVASLQTHYQGILHYGGGNLINLLRYLPADLTGYDLASCDGGICRLAS